MTADGPTEQELHAWLERRFPGGGPTTNRLRAGDRRVRRWRLVVLGSIPLAVVAGFLTALVRRSDGPTPVPGPSLADRYLPVQVLGWMLLIASLALIVYGLVRIVRVQLPLNRTPQARVLRSLDRRRRRELVREVTGRHPLEPGDDIVLTHVARAWVVQASSAGWVFAGNLLAQIAISLDEPGGAFDVVRAFVVVCMLYVVGAVIWYAIKGRAYLRARTEPSSTMSR